jgi:hypothetical protein
MVKEPLAMAGIEKTGSLGRPVRPLAKVAKGLVTYIWLVASVKFLPSRVSSRFCRAVKTPESLRSFWPFSEMDIFSTLPTLISSSPSRSPV